MRTFAQKPKATQQTKPAKSTKASPTPSDQRDHVHSMLQLQRMIGNQAVQRLLRTDSESRGIESSTTATARFAHDLSQIPVQSMKPVRIQPKLAVNAPGDIYEQEADRVAEQVLRMPEPQLQQNACPCGGGCPKCQTVQQNHQHERLEARRVRASDTEQVAAPPIVHEVSAGPGQPLDLATRAFFEPRFRHDFSHVRVHTDSRAADSARALNALAYTLGQHIVFDTGQYAPGTSISQHLLAHELTHVVQQNNSQPVLQKQKDANAKGTLEGGKARFEILEGDLARVIDNWLEGSRQAINQFVDSVLAEEIDKVESGSFKEFLTVMIGGAVWSAAAFTTGGLAFGVSVTGMSIQASTSWPSNSKTEENLDVVRGLLETRIEGIHDSLNKQLGSAARQLLKDDPGISRYRAIGRFLINNFQSDAIDVPDDHSYLPKINQTGVRERMFNRASQLWTNMRDVVSKTHLTGGAGILLYDTEKQRYFRLGADNDAIDLYRYSGGRNESALAMMNPYGGGEILPELVPAAKALAAKWPGYYFIGRRKPGTKSDWIVEAGVKLVAG